MIENQPYELTLIYHSDKTDDRKTRAYVESLTEYTIKTLDLKRTPLTETQIAEVAEKMGVSIRDLVDDSYSDRIPGTNAGILDGMSLADMLTVIKQQPIIIGTPVLIIGSKAYHYGSSYELIKEDMDAGVRHIRAGNVEESRDIH